MSLKLHFLHAHLNFLPKNLGAFSDDQGERFHEIIKVMKKYYQGRLDSAMLADYCWFLFRQTDNSIYKIRSTREFFQIQKVGSQHVPSLIYYCFLFCSSPFLFTWPLLYGVKSYSGVFTLHVKGNRTCHAPNFGAVCLFQILKWYL